jgi:hypothetical protein
VEEGRKGERGGERKQSRERNRQKVGCEIIVDNWMTTLWISWWSSSPLSITPSTSLSHIQTSLLQFRSKTPNSTTPPLPTVRGCEPILDNRKCLASNKPALPHGIVAADTRNHSNSTSRTKNTAPWRGTQQSGNARRDEMRHSDLDSDECEGLTNIQHALNRHRRRQVAHICMVLSECARGRDNSEALIRHSATGGAAEVKKECQSARWGLASDLCIALLHHCVKR